MFRPRRTCSVLSLAAIVACWTAIPAAADDPPASGSPPAGQATGGLLGELREEHTLLWQQAVKTFSDLESQTRAAVRAEDFAQAIKLSQEARYVIDRNRRYAPSAAEFEGRQEEARGLMLFVEDQKRAWEERKAQERQRELIRREEESTRRIEESKRQKIALLKNQADELSKERKYKDAIDILNSVLMLDPTDSEAAWKKTTFEDIASHMEARELVALRKRQSQDVLVRNEEAHIPWHQDILYPKNWPEIDASRKEVSEETDDEKTATVRRKLKDTIDEVQFDERPFESVIEYLGDLTGLNIQANWAALEAVAIEKDIPVTLPKLKEVAIGKLLDLVLEQVGGGETQLGYDIDEGVVTISTVEDLARRTILKVYNVEDLLISVPDFLGRPINLDNIGQNQGGGGGGGGIGGGGGGGGGFGGGSGGGIFGGGGGGFGGAGGEGEAEEEVDVDALIDLIQATIDPESWREAGGNIGSIRALRNQIIVTQTSTAHRQLRDLLTQLRQAHALQIAVESRFITVTRNYLEQIGVDLDVVLNNGNAGFDRAGFQNQPLRDPGTGALVLVPREFSRLGFTPGTPGGLGNTLPTQGFPQPFGQAGLVPGAGNMGPHSSRFTPVPIQNNTIDLAAPIATNIPGTLGGADVQPAFSLFGSFLDNIQVDFLLQATQVDARASDLDAPRLVLFNGQRALFSAFIEQQYVQTLIPVLGDNVGLFQPIIGIALTGRQLDVQATVSADRKYVTMTIRTFTRVSGDPVPFQFTGGSLTGGAGFVQLVRQTTNQVQTTVSVPDGGTLLIGGLKQAAERERDAGVPILSRIPVLKRAFSNSSLVKDDSVLLILIKPKIIIQEEAEQEAFPTLSRGERS